jgi:hypothetical protein
MGERYQSSAKKSTKKFEVVGDRQLFECQMACREATPKPLYSDRLVRPNDSARSS